MKEEVEQGAEALLRFNLALVNKLRTPTSRTTSRSIQGKKTLVHNISPVKCVTDRVKWKMARLKALNNTALEMNKLK